jgi:cyclic pyranopterin phosphate synthase
VSKTGLAQVVLLRSLSANAMDNRTVSKVIPLVDVRRAASRRTAAPLVERGPGPVRDTRARPLHDLRISVTDRCNFRCVYCMPKNVFDADYQFLPHADLLTFEEIARVARVAKTLGVGKIRLTGGEPLLRKHIERLVEMLAKLDLDLTLTTNGSALAQKARALRDAGLKRVTVSLDSLDDATFRAMNDVDFPVAKVLAAIDAAAAAGLAPVKVNAVVKRGVNDGEIVTMARHFKGTGHILRFIEYMDVGASNGWRMDDVIPSAEIVRRIGAQFPLAPVDANYEARSRSAGGISTAAARSAPSLR